MFTCPHILVCQPRLSDNLPVCTLKSCKAGIENGRVKLEDAIEIDTVDELPQTPRTADGPNGPKFDEGLSAPTNLSK